MNKTLFSLSAVLGFTVTFSAYAAADFNGVWQVTQPIAALKTHDGKTPPLLPDAAKLYAERSALYNANQAKQYDPAEQSCKPLGPWRNLYDASLPQAIQPFEIQQGATRLMFGYTWNRMLRFVDIKNEFSDIAGPTYYGTSIGKWDGNTLVITGKMFNDSTLLDAAGMPHSDALQTVERLSLTDANTLEDRITIIDPQIFSKDWETVVTFKKLPAGTKIQEDLCLQRKNITLKSPVAE